MVTLVSSRGGKYVLTHCLYVYVTNSNTAGSKIAKSIITRLTNRSNLGGTRLLRGYPEVEKQSKSKATTHSPKQSGAQQQERGMKPDEKLANDMTMAEQEMEDYDNEDSEEEVRSIDHLVFVIHG